MIGRFGSLVLFPTLIACSADPNPPPARGGWPPASASAATEAPAEEWGCLELKPGHPTVSEQEAFIEEVGQLASRAEARHGVPAAALVAIASLESGYGWSRLALNTNNLFAWKHFPGTATEGRRVWELDCEPPGSQFVMFADRADAVEFVARQLATSDNYRAHTERYRQDRTSGVGVVEAVNRWVEGAADPYSTQPEQWSRDVRRTMNDPYKLSDQPSPEHNLYRLSEAASASS